tara:strand:- start:884 stop:1225 length:342 start_codon:yes stop_codon:yes gene_type:complete
VSIKVEEFYKAVGDKRCKPVVCADGFTMSVQAHESAYCSPRRDYADPYTSVEVGFPSNAEPLLVEYAEDPESPTMTVYAWVPVQVVTNVIAKHGGMVEGTVPRGVIPLVASHR